MMRESNFKKKKKKKTKKKKKQSEKKKIKGSPSSRVSFFFEFFSE